MPIKYLHKNKYSLTTSHNSCTFNIHYILQSQLLYNKVHVQIMSNFVHSEYPKYAIIITRNDRSHWR